MTQVQNVASTASVANSSIDADCRLERSETANRTARLIASLVTGSAYSCVMTIYLLHQSHGNQADGCSFTWDYSAPAPEASPRLPVICKISKLARDFLMADAAIGGTILGCHQRAVSAQCWNSMTLDVALRDNTPTIDLLHGALPFIRVVRPTRARRHGERE